jgi:hypothetical protein
MVSELLEIIAILRKSVNTDLGEVWFLWGITSGAGISEQRAVFSMNGWG